MVSKQLKKSFNEITSFEKCLQRSEFSHGKLSYAAQDSLIDITKTLTAYLEQQKKHLSKLKDEDEFLIGALQLRLMAIKRQLNISGYDLLADDLSKIISPVENKEEN